MYECCENLSHGKSQDAFKRSKQKNPTVVRMGARLDSLFFEDTYDGYISSAGLPMTCASALPAS